MEKIFLLKWRHPVDTELRGDAEAGAMTRTGKKQIGIKYATNFTMNGNYNLLQQNKTKKLFVCKTL